MSFLLLVSSSFHHHLFPSHLTLNCLTQVKHIYSQFTQRHLINLHPSVHPSIRRKTEMTTEKPKVLVIGAGLGGVTLCLLLEKAGVNYELFERAAQVKPLGNLKT